MYNVKIATKNGITAEFEFVENVLMIKQPPVICIEGYKNKAYFPLENVSYCRMEEVDED